jgi:tryptophan synthase beta chain
MAMACAFYGLHLTVYMVKVSSEQKPYRKTLIETYGAKLIPSPSDTTEAGRKILAQDPNTGGSLGCAISEAVETAVKTEKCRYVLGSVLNHVLLHQSIIGQETKAAFDKYNIKPDIIIGCAGGGSNLGGLIAPFMGDKLKGKSDTRFIAVEPVSCPSFTRGRYAYDFGDTAKTTPLIRMYTLGNGFIPSANHAGGLRYHGMNPILSKLYRDGFLEARAEVQTDVFEAAVRFAKVEGILPAPESSHAIKVAIDEALACKRSGEKKTILFGLTGTGYFDMTAYMAYNAKTMTDYIPNEADLAKGFSSLPDIPQNH